MKEKIDNTGKEGLKKKKSAEQQKAHRRNEECIY